MRTIIFTILFFHVASFLTTDAKNCTLQWSSDLPSWFPMIWNNSEIVYPFKNGSGTWQIEIPAKFTLDIGCSEQQNLLKNFKLPQVTLTCNAKGILKYKTTSPKFIDLGCTSPLTEKVVESGICYNKSRNVNIQFESISKNFGLINICYDTKLEITLMAHHSIHGEALNPFEISNKRPSFKEAQFYPTISPVKAYSQKSQLAVVSELVRSSALGQKYINVSKSYYFARGHLAPDGDFVHIYEQNATYYFINAIPQWQSINNGNWKALEAALKKYATSKKVTLNVWTGGKDILQLDDVNGNPVEIYLAKDSKGKQLLPAPQITWKVIQDPGRNASVAVFMINNPHLTKVPSKLITCKDICSQLTWVTWKTNNISKGYTYCCEMSEAKKVLPIVPDLGNGKVMN